MGKKQGGSLSNAAATLGKKGGKFGGPARARALTPSERSAIARLGGKARQRGKQRKKG